jgi:hypothetical protein
MDGKMIATRSYTRKFKKKIDCYFFEEVDTSVASLLLHYSYPVLEPEIVGKKQFLCWTHRNCVPRVHT